MESASFLGWNVTHLISPENLKAFIRILVLIAVGIPLAAVLSRYLREHVSKRYTRQKGMVAGKLLLYSGLILLTATVMYELGFSLAPLLGAAGIVGIALGFASQTSVSNIISGFFLIAEQPFVVGDVIIIGDTRGTVLSIDVLSVKLRTLRNEYVRIPNESIIRTQLMNLTKFPIRRFDLPVSVAYKEDLARAQKILKEVAHEHPLVLAQPESQVFFDQFGSSSIDLILALWTAREDFLRLKHSIPLQIKERFDREGIEIPFPHLSIYAGSASGPLPVAVQSQSK
ncbi:MAG TPA: mechanosensitive ion channel family protein [Acidobacteriota bacterium]|nr:mechanosensitive ion channel family protein [Acidobacteriota bacterium]